jgi:arsenate reductase
VKILFLCTHNACRSILCEVIARELGGARIQAASAGSQPAGRIHPETLQALAARGYPSRGLSSKSIDDVQGFQPDWVITVCDRAAGESCPLWLGDVPRVHWGLPDPSHIAGGRQLRVEAFARVIDTIEQRLRALLALPFETLPDRALGPALASIAEVGS